MGIGYQKEIDVNVKSQTNVLYQAFFIKVLKDDITLTAPIIAGSRTFNVSAGHGFVTGDVANIAISDLFEQVVVKSVNVNEITVYVPFASSFPTGITKVIRGSKELNLLGSPAAEEVAYFRFWDHANSSIPIDVNFLIVNMIHSTEADDSLFGDLDKLGDPVYFRREGLYTINYGYFFNNQNFVDRGADLIYSDKAGGGKFSTKILFDLKKTFTNEIRLFPQVNDFISFHNQADLTDLDSFTMSAVASLATEAV